MAVRRARPAIPRVPSGLQRSLAGPKRSSRADQGSRGSARPHERMSGRGRRRRAPSAPPTHPCSTPRGSARAAWPRAASASAIHPRSGRAPRAAALAPCSPRAIAARRRSPGGCGRDQSPSSRSRCSGWCARRTRRWCARPTRPTRRSGRRTLRWRRIASAASPGSSRWRRLSPRSSLRSSPRPSPRSSPRSSACTSARTSTRPARRRCSPPPPGSALVSPESPPCATAGAA
mmetsp:Transcript_47564/g.124658  ORF Transcript_47564/g.124658 Transcript_47564/m.124658 type:complete len:232 (+) Transcript_47564:1143-1838(+)